MAPIVYQMAVGDDAEPSAGKAASELQKMKASLGRWLSYRARTDRTTPASARPALRLARLKDEQTLATTLGKLLTEAGFEGLPTSVVEDPDAATRLAGMVLRDEVGTPQSQGFWMLLIPVAGVVFLISYWIRSQADLAAEKERIRCIESGACTDSGFWLKVGGVSIVAWLVWEKFGGKEAIGKFKRKLA